MLKSSGGVLSRVVLVGVLCLTSMSALAELAPARIEAYIASLAEVRAMGDQLKAEGKQDLLARQIMPRAGEAFDPHQRAIRALKRDEPAYFARLEKSVLTQGFTSADSWAHTGDQIVLAYGAVKVSAESPQMLALAAQGGPEQELLLQTLPAQQRAQLQQALVVAKALSKVPEADRRAVRPYVGQLDKLFSQN
ncbi:hypothetical protein ADIMK_1104 [Marinobacterium lacunae]|uniref:Uncharacterized protein n=1 Tax=Marinobacterium lacunae TaxID=1232683 RepID=A0A081G1J6_9GAMM|nr:hypothetical protein [Marinobacterium lacunae]KEA64651.1 hypothetical protein ADIMK_1104 [Marinobacterium lacunae]MBR9882506.1 hypothetical protein [Oceanospirillales bacterium]